MRKVYTVGMDIVRSIILRMGGGVLGQRYAFNYCRNSSPAKGR